jgi:integrase
MMDGYTHPKHGPQEGLSRKLINKRIERIVHVFKWAAAEERVSAEVHHALKAVAGLQCGRTDARETEAVKPVADALVDPVRQHVCDEVAAMIRLQRLTGMRPGEVCIMRAVDIDMSGAVWIYRPPYHKLAYRGKPRVVAIGPRGQEIIKPFLQLDTQAYLFSPWRARERQYAQLRANRKTKVQPSQQNRRKRKPKRLPHDRYTTTSYAHAIKNGCDKAFPLPAPLARQADETHKEWQARLTPEQMAELAAWRKEHRWHPNQLRHSHATEVRRQFGLEAAQVALGHSQAQITQLYAERDLTLASKVAGAMG